MKTVVRIVRVWPDSGYPVHIVDTHSHSTSMNITRTTALIFAAISGAALVCIIVAMANTPWLTLNEDIAVSRFTIWEQNYFAFLDFENDAKSYHDTCRSRGLDPESSKVACQYGIRAQRFMIAALVLVILLLVLHAVTCCIVWRVETVNSTVVSLGASIGLVIGTAISGGLIIGACRQFVNLRQYWFSQDSSTGYTLDYDVGYIFAVIAVVLLFVCPFVALAPVFSTKASPSAQHTESSRA